MIGFSNLSFFFLGGKKEIFFFFYQDKAKYIQILLFQNNSINIITIVYFSRNTVPLVPQRRNTKCEGGRILIIQCDATCSPATLHRYKGYTNTVLAMF
jgi:hypothetical protein